jgi:hypothetical protein
MKKGWGKVESRPSMASTEAVWRGGLKTAWEMARR